MAILSSVFSWGKDWVVSKVHTVLLYFISLCHKLDERHRLSDDWFIITFFVKAVAQYGYYVLSHRLNYWYKFEKQVSKFPNHKALVFVAKFNGDNCPIEQFTYQQVYDMVLRLSHILANEYKVKPNDTIGIDMHNGSMFVFLWFALWNLGARPVFFNYNVSANALVHCAKVAEVSQIFTDQETQNAVFASDSETSNLFKSQLSSVGIHLLDADVLKKISDPLQLKFRLPDNLRNKSDKAWNAGCYIFTSGTTGLPKAAIMSWRKINLGTSLYGRIVRISSTSTVFCAMPLYHSTGSILGLLPTWNQGGCFAVADKFSASNFWRQAKACEASHIQYVGEICRYLVNRPANPELEQNHKVIVAYGNGLRKDIWNTFKHRFHVKAIGEFFASTEAPIATTSFQYGDYGVGACRNYGTIINYILSFQQRLVEMDPNDPTQVYRDPTTGLGREPAVDQPGQLLFRITRPKTPYVDFQGYKNNHSDTNKKIIRDVYKKGDCWMLTGDLIKQDKYGLYYFVDRLGDTFRWKSENVSTNEVEMEIIRSGLVQNAVVVGLRLEKYEGRAGYMIIQPFEGESIDLKSLYDYLRSHLPKYAIPVFVKTVDRYKTTDTHKIIKPYYSNEKFYEEHNDEGDVYYLASGGYEFMTKEKWEDIQSGVIKL